MDLKKSTATFQHVRDTITSESIRAQFNAKLKYFEDEMNGGEVNWHQEVEKNNFRMFTQPSPKSFIVKSETECNHSIATLIPYIRDMSIRHRYDNLIDSVVKIKDIASNIQIYYAQFKGKYLIVTPRDAVFYRVGGYVDENVRYYYIDIRGDVLDSR